MHFLLICHSFAFCISKDSVVTCVRYDWKYYTIFVENLILFPVTEEFLKSVKICHSRQSRQQISRVQFYLSHCILACKWTTLSRVGQHSFSHVIFTRRSVQFLHTCTNTNQRERERERQTDRHRHRHRQTDRQTDRGAGESARDRGRDICPAFSF